MRVGGELRATSRGAGHAAGARRGARARHRVRDRDRGGGRGAARAGPLLRRPRGHAAGAPRPSETASFATLNDLHFGEPRFGGTLLANGDYGPEAPGFPSIRADDTEVPYWRFMNEDAIAEINAAGVDATFIKGDIADVGRPEQFAAARDAFAKLARAAPRLPRQPRLLRPPRRARGGRLRAARSAAAPRAASTSAAGGCCCSRRRCPASTTASSTTSACAGSRARSTRRARRARRPCC